MRKLILTAVALIAVGGCSSPAQHPEVATLASAEPTTASATPSKAQQRPQLRLDTSDEERDRLFTAYDDCLVGHGVKMVPVQEAAPAGVTRRLDDSGEPKAAYLACAGKLPLQPIELDPDRNPRFAEQWNDNVRCLRKHGLK